MLFFIHVPVFRYSKLCCCVCWFIIIHVHLNTSSIHNSLGAVDHSFTVSVESFEVGIPQSMHGVLTTTPGTTMLNYTWASDWDHSSSLPPHPQVWIMVLAWLIDIINRYYGRSHRWYSYFGCKITNVQNDNCARAVAFVIDWGMGASGK